MASTAAAYPNSDDSGSAKEREYFSVADLQNFFDNCPPELVKHRCLKTIKGMFRALEKRLGKKLHGGAFEFCLAIEDYRAGAFYRSTATVRVNLRLAEKLGYIEAVYGSDEMGRPRRDHFWHRPRTAEDKGLYRRVATYRLNTALLEKFRELQRHGHSAEVTPIRRKPSAPADKPLPPTHTAPLPKREEPAATKPEREKPSTEAMSRSEERAWKRRQAVKATVDHFIAKAGLGLSNAIRKTMHSLSLTQQQVESDLAMIKYEPPSPPPEKKLRRPCEQISDERNPWKKILGTLKSKINPHSYETWLAPTRYDHMEGDVLYVRVPSIEFRHAGDKYGALIREAIDGLGLELADVKFVTADLGESGKEQES
jgi:hypothetical protein